jgi:hypothetical protein
LPVNQPWQQDDSTISSVLQNQVIRTEYTVQNTCNFSLKLTKKAHFLPHQYWLPKQIAPKLK